MPYREEVLANRRLVIDFLKQPERKKARNALDRGGENRCCLGHMCFALSEKLNLTIEEEGSLRLYDSEMSHLPETVENALGMYDVTGITNKPGCYIVIGKRSAFSLANLNDYTKIRPQQIAAYLETVIEGGPETPWKSLKDYKNQKET